MLQHSKAGPILQPKPATKVPHCSQQRPQAWLLGDFPEFHPQLQSLVKEGGNISADVANKKNSARMPQ
jgi:hypothetical protein